MKKKITFIAISFLFLLITSCKKDGVSEDNYNQADSEKDFYSVEMDVVFTKNDNIQVFYLLKGSDWNDGNSISKPIYASNQMQKMVFDLPKNITPENFRIDFGFNSTQTNITIKNITIKYKNQIIDGDLGNFSKYFTSNPFISWDPDYFGYKLNKINDEYDPFMIGNDLLISKLKKFKSN